MKAGPGRDGVGASGKGIGGIRMGMGMRQGAGQEGLLVRLWT